MGTVIAVVLVAYVALMHVYALRAIMVECGGSSRFGPCVSAEWLFYGVLGVLNFLPIAIAIAVAALWRGRVGRSLPRAHQLFVIASSLFAFVVWLLLARHWRGNDNWLALGVPMLVTVALIRIGAGQHASWRPDADEAQD